MALRFPAFGTGFTLALSSQSAMAVSDDGKWLFVPTSGTTPFGGLGKLVSGGYSQVTGLTQPTITANSRQLPAFSPDNKKIAISGHAVADGMPVYSVAANGQITHDTVDVAPTIISRSVAFHPNGLFLVIGWTTATTTVFTVYKKINGATDWQWVADYGTSVSVGSATISVVFNADGSKLAICGTTTPFIRVFDFNGSTGAATEISSVFTAVPLTGISQIIFNPANDDLIASVSAAPRARYWQWNSGTSKYTLQSYGGSFAGTNGGSLSVDEEGKHLMVVANASPFIQHFDISSRALVDATNPDETTIGSGSGRIAFSKKGPYLVYSTGNSPNNYLCDVRNAADMTAISGFLPTVVATMTQTAGTSATTYDATGYLMTSVTPIHAAMEVNYAGTGFLMTSDTSIGYRDPLTYDATGYLMTSDTPIGYRDPLTYDATGYLMTSVIPLTVETIEVTFDATGFLMTSDTPIHAAMEVNYAGTGFLMTSVIPIDQDGGLTYNASGYLMTAAVLARYRDPLTYAATGFLATASISLTQDTPPPSGEAITDFVILPANTWTQLAEGSSAIRLALQGGYARIKLRLDTAEPTDVDVAGILLSRIGDLPSSFAIQVMPDGVGLWALASVDTHEAELVLEAH